MSTKGNSNPRHMHHKVNALLCSTTSSLDADQRDLGDISSVQRDLEDRSA